MEGWIKIHRKITEWEWYTDQTTLAVFLHLLLIANPDERRYRGHVVKRGECIIGRKSLSSELHISEQKVRTALNHLISTNEITIRPTNKYSIVTICNFDSYQVEKKQTNQQKHQQDNQQLTNNQPTTNQQLTTPKEYKNIRIKNNIIEDKSSISERKKEFGNKIKPYVNIYGDKMCNDFFLYWTECNENGKKMRFEMNKVFSIPARLDRWSKNNYNNNSMKVYRNNQDYESAKENNEI